MTLLCPYSRNGRLFGQVSQVLNLDFPYTGPTTGSTEARDKGTALHAMIDCRLTTGMKSGHPEMAQFEAFLADHPFLTAVMHERPIFSETHGIAGTPDAIFYCAETDRYVLADWKRIRGLYPSSAVRYQMQLNLYKQFVLEDLGMKIDDMVHILFYYIW